MCLKRVASDIPARSATSRVVISAKDRSSSSEDAAASILRPVSTATLSPLPNFNSNPAVALTASTHEFSGQYVNVSQFPAFGSIRPIPTPMSACYHSRAGSSGRHRNAAYPAVLIGHSDSPLVLNTESLTIWGSSRYVRTRRSLSARWVVSSLSSS